MRYYKIFVMQTNKHYFFEAIDKAQLHRKVSDLLGSVDISIFYNQEEISKNEYLAYTTKPNMINFI